ncbi:MAG: hypothetical protein APF76_03650 [Desulfitibacter sp. BRH_c19]|nr:MAG: hypothetical protein APF76_03650 [Desulfitibacter sp. BRH_c19]
MDIKIDYLINHPNLIEEISKYFYSEWGYLYPERSIKEFEVSISERLNLNKLPLALVAMDQDKFIGTVCLKEYDMETRNDITPWLAGLYVKEEFRNKGVGKILIDNIIEVAKKMGINTLYLYTPNAKEYYKKFNWSAIDQKDYCGTNFTIMKKSLQE